MRLLRVAEVAAILGISRRRAYELVRAGMLPGVHLGRQVRVSDEALRRFVEKGGQTLRQRISSAHMKRTSRSPGDA